jgi:hypothetical protein
MRSHVSKPGHTTGRASEHDCIFYGRYPRSQPPRRRVREERIVINSLMLSGVMVPTSLPD